MSRLLAAAGTAPFVFVVGKGGVGKTTAAGALALELADAGTETHLISTDPAHSLADLFQQEIGAGTISRCSPRLRVEEFDAALAGDAWMERALGSVMEIVEGGTYLDAEDVSAFSRLALPGLDEMMAVLRLADLSEAGRTVVVDTAPAGHTLRLLDAAATHEGIARTLRAMAAKATAVAGAMTGRSVRLSGERIIDEMERYVATYRQCVLAPAAFVVVTRAGAVVAAETGRLERAVHDRNLRIAAVLATGGAVTDGVGPVETGSVMRLQVPLLNDPVGCQGLRMWREHVQPGHSRTSGPGPVSVNPVAADPLADRTDPEPAAWLLSIAPRLLLFAGKGGVGKSTCAAAAALTLCESRDVLLCSTDPAGSLVDLLGQPENQERGRLRIMQIDPSAQLTRLRDGYRQEITRALDQVGLSESAELDRRVIESLWDLAPPGLDELAATAAMVDAAHTDETVVIDSAPTGHFLRLLEMPDVALGWTRQLMRIIVKYGIAAAAAGAAESLLELTRELKWLRDVLHDPEAAAVVVVTLDEPMVRAETDRLIASLVAANIQVGAVLLNHARTLPDEHLRHGLPLVLAPETNPPPAGEHALRGFVDAWKIVA